MTGLGLLGPACSEMTKDDIRDTGNELTAQRVRRAATMKP